jgi:hypothetical protein
LESYVTELRIRGDDAKATPSCTRTIGESAQRPGQSTLVALFPFVQFYEERFEMDTKKSDGGILDTHDRERLFELAKQTKHYGVSEREPGRFELWESLHAGSSSGVG